MIRCREGKSGRQAVEHSLSFLVSSLHCLPVQNYDDSNRSGAVHALHVWLQEVAVVAVERGRRHEVVIAAQVGRGLVQLIVPVSDNGLARGQGDAEGDEWERVHTQIMISARLHVGTVPRCVQCPVNLLRWHATKYSLQSPCLVGLT